MIADDALVEPAPAAPPLSMTTTFRPAFDNSSAIDAPITPPPIMTTSVLVTAELILADPKLR